MIRTFIDLPLAEGDAERLLHLFRRLRVLEVCESQRGCRSAEPTIAEVGSRAVATAVWDDHDAYDKWLDRPDRARFGGATAELLDTAVPGEVTGSPLPDRSPGYLLRRQGRPQRGGPVSSNRLAVDVGGTFTDVVSLDDMGRDPVREGTHHAGRPEPGGHRLHRTGRRST